MEKVRNRVVEILGENENGHGMDHIDRVFRLAMKFAEQENANIEIVALAALLHDVDDYKIVGAENSLKMSNAIKIMNENEIDKDVQDKVLDIVKSMGYTKLLRGIRPTTIEGMVVSDADMCDAIGANGIIRAVLYAVSDLGNGKIFDKEVFPMLDITANEYNINVTTHDTDSVINHFFEKMLKLKKLMLTKSGKEAAKPRHTLLINFLEQFFQEENTPEWAKLLNLYNDEELLRIFHL